MANILDKSGATKYQIFAINQTASDLTTNLQSCQVGIETDTGLFGFKDHTGAYKRLAPKSTITARYIPKCKTAATGELENSIAAETASEFVINGAEADKNFRVGTNGASYGIYHDAGLNRTGLGEGTPAYRLSITDANPAIALKDSDTNAIALINASSSAGTLAIDADAFDAVASSKLTLGVDGAVAVTVLAGGNVGIGPDITPLGIQHTVRTITTNPSTGIRLNVGNTAADSGTFTRDSTANPPIVLADAGNLTDDGILDIIIEDTIAADNGTPGAAGFHYSGYIHLSATYSYDDECYGPIRRHGSGLFLVHPLNGQAGYQYTSVMGGGSSCGLITNNADDDGYLCLNPDGNSNHLRIKNRLGGTAHISYYAVLNKVVWDDL